MLKNITKFIVKVALLAAVVKFVILPHIPGLPDFGSHLPSWQTAVKFVLDPAGLTDKADHLAQWATSKLPSISIGGHQLPKPQVYTPTNPPNNVGDVVDPGHIFHH